MRRDILSCLLQCTGSTVPIAANGGEGVDRARIHGPDLVLMNQTLPVLYGRVAVRRLRAGPATVRCPAGALATHATNARAARCRDASVMRPVEPRRLRIAITRRFEAS